MRLQLMGRPRFGDIRESRQMRMAEGQRLIGQKEYKGALINFRSALELAELSYGTRHPLVALAFAMIGFTHFVQDRFKKAAPFFQKAIDMYKVAMPKDPLPYIAILKHMGKVLEEADDYGAAEEQYMEGLKILRAVKEPGQKHLHLEVELLHDLGKLNHTTRDFQAAEGYFTQALGKDLVKAQVSAAGESGIQESMARNYADWGKRDLARAAIEKSLKTLHTKSPKDLALIPKFELYAQLLEAAGETDRAGKVRVRIKSLQSGLG